MVHLADWIVVSVAGPVLVLCCLMLGGRKYQNKRVKAWNEHHGG